MALFGAPVAHGDDATRAVLAAFGIQRALAELNEAHPEFDLKVRIGVNTGEAFVDLAARPELGEGMAAGDVVVTAFRLQQSAPVSGIVVGEATYRASQRSIGYREIEPIAAKGKEEPVRAWEAVAVEDAADRPPPCSSAATRAVVPQLARIRRGRAETAARHAARSRGSESRPCSGLRLLVTGETGRIMASGSASRTERRQLLGVRAGEATRGILETPEIVERKVSAAVRALVDDTTRHWIEAYLGRSSVSRRGTAERRPPRRGLLGIGSSSSARRERARGARLRISLFDVACSTSSSTCTSGRAHIP
jgi:hypothetical protein